MFGGLEIDDLFDDGSSAPAPKRKAVQCLFLLIC
jgi:hypothetical protein